MGDKDRAWVIFPQGSYTNIDNPSYISSFCNIFTSDVVYFQTKTHDILVSAKGYEVQNCFQVDFSITKYYGDNSNFHVLLT